MKRSIISLLVQSVYRTSITLMDNFTARADYIKCLVWLQASAALLEDGRFNYVESDSSTMETIFDMKWIIPSKEELAKVSPYQYPPNRLDAGKSVLIEKMLSEGKLTGKDFLVLDHATHISEHFPQVIGRGLRRDVPTVIFDEDCLHPSEAAFGRMQKRLQSMRKDPQTDLNIPVGIAPKWEDFDNEKLLKTIQEIREIDPVELDRQRREFLDSVWDPEFKARYESDMVKKGGH